jgi:hypothetical protein
MAARVRVQDFRAVVADLARLLQNGVALVELEHMTAAQLASQVAKVRKGGEEV